MGKRKVQLATLLVVGEGAHDKAFLNHLRDLFDGRETGQKVKVQSSDGGSPRDIIKAAIKSRHAAYDRRVVFMDSDIPLSDKDTKYAQMHKIELILSEPLCLEGMLLEILSESIPNDCRACKRTLHPKLSGVPTKKESYAILFTKTLLGSCNKNQIKRLIEILKNV